MQSVKFTDDKGNRKDFKNRLQSKIETTLTPPPLPEEPTPEPIEIVEKYSTWVPARLALESEELFLDFKKEEEFIPQGEIVQREAVKTNLSKKIENSAT